MDIVQVLGLYCVCSFVLFSVLTRWFEVNIGCGPFVYVFIGLVIGVFLIQEYGSRDPNSFFVRQNLIIGTNIEYKPYGDDEYKKGLLIGKGRWFADSKEIIPLELIYRDEEGTEQTISLDCNEEIPFGRVSTVYDWDNGKYYFRLNKFITNMFHENYYPSKTDDDQVEEYRDWFEKRYEDI